jgi:hypothetical protein
MKKFNQFYLEKLLESVLEASPEFFDLIRHLPSEKISDHIHSWIEDRADIQTKYNYLNIDDKNADKLLFLPDNQFQRAKSEGKDAYSKTKSDSALGRFARALMKDNGITVTDPEVERFVNAYKKEWLDRYTEPNFRIIKGDEILHWYLESNYYQGGKSTLGNSCMRYANRNHLMKIYAENPDVISMAIMTKPDEDGEEKLVSRGLIWKIEENKYYSDRIYYNSDPLQPLMKKLIAQELGGEIIFYEKSDVPDIAINLKKTVFDLYPYADSLYYVATKLIDGELSDGGLIFSKKHFDENYDELKDKLAIIKIQSTSGDPDFLNTITLPKYNYKIFLKSEVTYYNGDSYPIKDTNYSKYADEYIPKELTIFSEYLNDWILKRTHIMHPDFGAVPNDLFANIITKYIGDKSYPWDIYDDIYKNIKDVVEFRIIPKNSRTSRKAYFQSPYYGTFSGIDVYWLNKFKSEVEFGDYESVSLFDIKIVSISDTSDIPNGFLFRKNWMLRIDAKLLGVPQSLITKESITHLKDIQNDFKRLNYKKVSDLISSNRNLTTREKKWRKSLLDLFDNKYDSDNTYIAYNKIENIDELIYKSMEIHKKWHYENFVSDNYKSIEEYVKVKVLTDMCNKADWSGVSEDIKNKIYEYIPKMQYMWSFGGNTTDAKETLKETLKKHNFAEFNNFLNTSIARYDDVFVFLRYFLYYFEDNSRSYYIDKLRSDFGEETFDLLYTIIKDMVYYNKDFPQILEY